MTSNNKYNPFNPLKILKHVEYWKSIPSKIPPPIFITVDPINVCNFNCKYCNSSMVRNKHIKMSSDYLKHLADLISKWGVKAVCIAGGGEPLLNDNLPTFLLECKNRNIQTAIVTNGSYINKFIPYLMDCTWIGISVDSSSEETYSKLKGVRKDTFHEVIENIQHLVNYKKLNNSKVQIGYKFLIHPYNYNEIIEASKIANKIGCDLIHIRPGGNPWFELETDKNEFCFTSNMIKESNIQIDKAKQLYESDRFKIYNMMYKFTYDWKPKITYNKCNALYTNCYFSPYNKLSLCCDRRGDKRLELMDITTSTTVNDINKIWGSDIHTNIVNSIEVKKCPRCTYSHVNEVFENVILEDSMMCNFI